MRLRIYEFLFPHWDVPARGLSYGKQMGRSFFKSILLVNRQIYEEAIGILYGARLFEVEFNGHDLSMCNLPRGPGHQFQNASQQDYQMQLMLLEQQNRRRLMLARAPLTPGLTTSAPAPPPPPPPPPMPPPPTNGSLSSRYLNPLSISTILGPVDPIWVPPISWQRFNLIQSFRVHIIFAFPGQPASAAADEKMLESKLYIYTDHLHRLVGRLHLLARPIARLEIAIRFENNPYMERKTAFNSAAVLLRPFRRLRNVSRAEVVEIAMIGPSWTEVDLLPTQASNMADMTFTGFLEYWHRDLCSDEEQLEDSSVFEAFWDLKKMVESILRHNDHHPKLEEFSDLLHAARIVREDDNLPQFREIWDQIVNIWFDHLNQEKAFHSSVASSIEAIYNMIGGGSAKD